MPTFDVDFEVFCSCGEGLCNVSETRVSKNRGVPQVVVEPCSTCVDRAKDSGYDKGYKEGQKDMEE